MKTRASKKVGAAGRKVARTATKPIIQKIIVATDFSPQSLPGVRYALFLGATVGASVTLLHVVELAASMPGMESVILARTDSKVATLADTQLKVLARREYKGAGTIATVIRIGRPFHEICLAAAELKAELIVVATHGYTGLKRVWLGSTAERVVRHAPCPVLTIPTRSLPKRATPAASLRIKSILVPIDFSNVSKDALPYAILLAGQFGAELTLIYVVQTFPIDQFLGAEITNHTIVPLVKQAEAELERLATDLAKSAGVKASVVVRVGKPSSAICLAARTCGADLIILTTRGYSGLKHVWLGSTAEQVVRNSSCPVLAVRELTRTSR